MGEDNSLMWGTFHKMCCFSKSCGGCGSIVNKRNEKLGVKLTDKQWVAFDKFWSNAESDKNRFDRCLEAFKAGVSVGTPEQKEEEFGPEYVRVDGVFVLVSELLETETRYVKVGNSYIDKAIVADYAERR